MRLDVLVLAFAHVAPAVEDAPSLGRPERLDVAPLIDGVRVMAVPVLREIELARINVIDETPAGPGSDELDDETCQPPRPVSHDTLGCFGDVDEMVEAAPKPNAD